MLKLIKEHSWWISLVLTIAGIIISIFPTESKVCLTKIISFAKEPMHIIIGLLVFIIILIIKKR